MRRTRLESRSTGKRSAPILYWMPEHAVPGDWTRELAGYAQQAFVPIDDPTDRYSDRLALCWTGQLCHVFVDQNYVDTFLSPTISNLFEHQAREPHMRSIAEALAGGER